MQQHPDPHKPAIEQPRPDGNHLPASDEADDPRPRDSANEARPDQRELDDDPNDRDRPDDEHDPHPRSVQRKPS